MGRYLFTSESVTEGHPDKLCDCISDAVLDALLEQDPHARCACEVTAAPGQLHIMGEITTTASVNYEAIARETIREIGYDKDEYGFNAGTVEVRVSLHQQSPDIAIGVDRSQDGAASKLDELGAGDQGMMFGYACDDTPERMPMPISLAHALTHKLTEVRKNGALPYLRPDGKAQVTIEYADDKPVRVADVVISAQHDPEIAPERLRGDLYEQVILPVIPAAMMRHTKVHINPTGRFVLGGPAADTGLTGRKIIVDTYGGFARHGGGAFSGKDPTKVDRSAAYMARYLAKNVVAAGLARRCEIQLSYAIGIAQPVSLMVDTFGTGAVPDELLSDLLRSNVDLTPTAIIETLDLQSPVYRATAAYGHFGAFSKENPWEAEDLAHAILVRVQEQFVTA